MLKPLLTIKIVNLIQLWNDTDATISECSKKTVTKVLKKLSIHIQKKKRSSFKNFKMWCHREIWFDWQVKSSCLAMKKKNLARLQVSREHKGLSKSTVLSCHLCLNQLPRYQIMTTARSNYIFSKLEPWPNKMNQQILRYLRNMLLQ